MQDVDRKWLEDLWSVYGGRVWAYAARRVGRQLADDVVADVFLVAWRRRHLRPAEPLPWLYGVARRVLADHYRAESRRARLIERVGRQPHFNAGVDDSVSSSIWLASALAKLSDPDREALLLTAWEGLKPSEAAAVLGITAPAFRMRLNRPFGVLDTGPQATVTIEYWHGSSWQHVCTLGARPRRVYISATSTRMFL
jgi:RNA polymerase sigma-70 factor, ECF subfamily